MSENSDKIVTSAIGSNAAAVIELVRAELSGRARDLVIKQSETPIMPNPKKEVE